MTSTGDKRQRAEPVPIKVGFREKEFEDLAGQVLGDMRARMENLRGEINQPITQSKVAQAMDVDRSSISKMLGGETNLTLRKIADFAAATGSSCYFRMVRNPESHLHVNTLQTMNMVVPTAKGTKKRHGLTFAEMLNSARNYIEGLILEEALLDQDLRDKLWVGPRDDNDKWAPFRIKDTNDRYSPFDDKQKKDSTISVWLGEGEAAGDCDLILFIAVEFTFADGFSEIEWVLYDVKGEEHYRSRDLQQVARLAGIVLSRGGFHA